MRLLIAGIFIVFVSCTNEEKNATQKESAKSDSVKVFILKRDSVAKTVTLPGNLIPLEKVQVRAKISGYIEKLNVDIGSYVKKGQLLATIKAPELETQLKELNAKVLSAKAKYESSKDYFDRINLAFQKKGVIAPNEWQRTNNQMLADSLDYMAARLSASALHQVNDYLMILAPFDGEITQRNIEVGSYVGGLGDKPMLVIENHSLLRLQVAIPEIYTSAELMGSTGEMTTRSAPDKKIKVKRVRKSGSVDPETRSEIWEFELPNQNNEIKAGSYADVKLTFHRDSAGFVAPGTAVVNTLEKRFVTKISSGTVMWIDVRPGFNLGDRSEVFGDLHAGDTLVVKGDEELKPGTLVTIKF